MRGEVEGHMMRPRRVAEVRAEQLLTELLSAQGWNTLSPPRGELLRQQEYKDYPHLLEIFKGNSKANRGGDGLPEALLVDENLEPLAVVEVKSSAADLSKAIDEVTNKYGKWCIAAGYAPLAIALAGTTDDSFGLRIFKWAKNKWVAVTYDNEEISWIPNRADLERLRTPNTPAELRQSVPPMEVLAARADGRARGPGTFRGGSRGTDRAARRTRGTPEGSERREATPSPVLAGAGPARRCRKPDERGHREGLPPEWPRTPVSQPAARPTTCGRRAGLPRGRSTALEAHARVRTIAERLVLRAAAAAQPHAHPALHDLAIAAADHERSRQLERLVLVRRDAQRGATAARILHGILTDDRTRIAELRGTVCVVAQRLGLRPTAAAERHARVTQQHVAVVVAYFDVAAQQQWAIARHEHGVRGRHGLGRTAVMALEVQGPRGAALHNLGDRIARGGGGVDPRRAPGVEHRGQAQHALGRMRAAAARPRHGDAVGLERMHTIATGVAEAARGR